MPGGVASGPLPNSVGTIVKIIKAITSAINADLTGTGAKLFEVKIDCSSNTGEDVYIAIYDAATATPGTDAPFMLLPGFKGVTKTYVIGRGKKFFTGISVAAMTERGGESGPTSPTGTVSVTLILSPFTP